jgi:hypothetical protein
MSGRFGVAVFTAVGALAIIMIALPAGHELGHYLTAQGFHVPVEDTTWTLLGRTPPSVQYRDASVSAQAWIAAGGVFLPTTLGVLVLLLWLRLSAKVPRAIRLLWLMLGFGYALNGAGPTLDLATGRFSHLQRLAELYHLGRVEVAGLHLAPLVVVLCITGLVGFHQFRERLRDQKRAEPIGSANAASSRR